jgi:hypothetical protein
MHPFSVHTSTIPSTYTVHPFQQYVPFYSLVTSIPLPISTHLFTCSFHAKFVCSPSTPFTPFYPHPLYPFYHFHSIYSSAQSFPFQFSIHQPPNPLCHSTYFIQPIPTHPIILSTHPNHTTHSIYPKSHNNQSILSNPSNP